MEIKEKLTELYHLPKWRIQRDFVDNLEIENPNLWLLEVDRIWDIIPSDRRDKFYYLIDRLAVNISGIDFVCQLTNLKYYIIKNNINNFSSSSIFHYIKNYKIYDFDLFNQVDFDLNEVERVLKEEKVINREFLSRYLQNKSS